MSSVESRRTSIEFLDSLSREVVKLSGGQISMGQFNGWFANSRCEDRIDDSDAWSRMGWSVQDTLWQYESFGDRVEPRVFIDSIEEALRSVRT
jgi:hypothetical protein